MGYESPVRCPPSSLNWTGTGVPLSAEPFLCFTTSFHVPAAKGNTTGSVAGARRLWGWRGHGARGAQGPRLSPRGGRGKGSALGVLLGLANTVALCTAALLLRRESRPGCRRLVLARNAFSWRAQGLRRPLLSSSDWVPLRLRGETIISQNFTFYSLH